MGTGVIQIESGSGVASDSSRGPANNEHEDNDNSSILDQLIPVENRGDLTQATDTVELSVIVGDHEPGRTLGGGERGSSIGGLVGIDSGEKERGREPPKPTHRR